MPVSRHRRVHRSLPRSCRHAATTPPPEQTGYAKQDFGDYQATSILAGGLDVLPVHRAVVAEPPPDRAVVLSRCPDNCVAARQCGGQSRRASDQCRVILIVPQDSSEDRRVRPPPPEAVRIKTRNVLVGCLGIAGSTPFSSPLMTQHERFSSTASASRELKQHLIHCNVLP